MKKIKILSLILGLISSIIIFGQNNLVNAASKNNQCEYKYEHTIIDGVCAECGKVCNKEKPNNVGNGHYGNNGHQGQCDNGKNNK